MPKGQQHDYCQGSNPDAGPTLLVFEVSGRCCNQQSQSPEQGEPPTPDQAQPYDSQQYGGSQGQT
jgi:hypothetical protein